LYFRISADRLEVLAGQTDRRASRDNWIVSSVSEIYLHEDYLRDIIYNDIALLRVSVSILRR
jgi:hypothetical protein